MALNPRNFTLPGQWAADASTNIPMPPVKGVAYRDTTIDASNLQHGQDYFTAFDSARWNQVMYVLTGLLMQFESHGFAIWSPYTNYDAAVGMALGADGTLYVAIAPSGPGNGGAQNPTSTTGYWQTFAEFVRAQVGDVGVYVGEIRLLPFRSTELPAKWYFGNGQVYSSGTPQYAALAGLSAQFKLDWGIVESGGTINLPNLLYTDGRGGFVRAVDGSARQPGSWETDAIRNIAGVLYYASFVSSGTGPFYAGGNGPSQFGQGSSGTVREIGFDASRAVPTATENRPLNVGMTPAIYLGV